MKFKNVQKIFRQKSYIKQTNFLPNTKKNYLKFNNDIDLDSFVKNQTKV